MNDKLIDTYDAVVIGGGAAGLNGALLLARSRRSVVVIDAGMPRNAPAEGVHGLLGHDGLPPAELLARGRDEVRRYGGEVVTGEARGITVTDAPVSALEVRDDRLTGVRLASGASLSIDAFAVMPHMVARAEFLADLGLRPVPHPSGIGEHIPADPSGRTDVPGVWAAGNTTDVAAQVGASAAAGALAAQQINADLVAEDAKAAVQHYGAAQTSKSE